MRDSPGKDAKQKKNVMFFFCRHVWTHHFVSMKWLYLISVLDVGYVQGMNDILSRFLIVLGSEAEAYWCFTNYMDTVKGDFLDDGMLNKISTY